MAQRNLNLRITSQRLAITCLILLVFNWRISANAFQDVELGKEKILSAIAATRLPADDFALIEANVAQLSVEHLNEIQRFMTNPTIIADSRWFDVSEYSDWNDYNFYRPIGDTVLGILARRDLFLDPARQLNNRALTNMSPEALAALAFSQVYVEEKWDHEVPWDGDSNEGFNWAHPDLTRTSNPFLFVTGDFLYQERVGYWWATYWSLPMSVAAKFGFGRGSDVDAALTDMYRPNPNAPRLSGYGYPLGNQLYLQTAETVYWYADYLKYGAVRYGAFDAQDLDTNIDFASGSSEILSQENAQRDSLDAQFSNYPGLWEIFNAPFAADLRIELTHPETAAFWNVMRFLHAAARQREGGASPEYPGNGQLPLFALQYELRSPSPVGRKENEVSAFALLTTVYSDSLLLDFTNWDANTQTLIHVPVDASRSDGIHRQVSERNKAILVIEQMGNENNYTNATHIAGSRGLGLNLTTQYDDPVNGDFLPYTPWEAHALVMALVAEVEEYGIEDSRHTLCNSPLLRRGYEVYIGQPQIQIKEYSTWEAIESNLCDQ